MSDLPPGFVLDPPKAAGLPPGFVLDTPPPRPVGAAMSVNNPPPQIAPGPRTSQMPTPQRSWADVPGEAFSNLPASAGNFVSALTQPFLHPQDTAESLWALGKGVASKLSPEQKTFTPSGTGKPRFQAVEQTPEQNRERAAVEAPADAVGEFFAERYGSIDGFKNALATDPVGVAADVATVLTGGGAIAARAPGAVGTAGQIVGKVGAAVDPLTQAGNVLKLGGKGVEAAVSNTLGGTTGAGKADIRTAATAGREGNEAFRQNMRGQATQSDAVDLARDAVGKIREERSGAYKAGMADVAKDSTALDFAPIDQAVAKANDVGSFKGVVVNRNAGQTVDKITELVNEWRALDPAEYHTAVGLDALKRTIGDLRDSTEFGTPARVAADRVYNAVKGEIEKQAPAYSKVMEDYAKSSDKIKQATKTFSLGEKATDDTALRKLQSASRNNAQTNYGERANMLAELAERSPDLPYALAGQNLNALAPRGLVAKLIGGTTGAVGIATNPYLIATAPAFSPRIVGEGAYLAGRGAAGVDAVGNALRIDAPNVRGAGQVSYQAGRADDLRARARALRNSNALAGAR